jgi:hypothetical protein
MYNVMETIYGIEEQWDVILATFDSADEAWDYCHELVEYRDVYVEENNE